MIRNICVICDYKCFVNVFDVITSINITTDTDYSSDELLKLNFIGCKNCGCVQLENLFDLDTIYKEPMQCFNGPSLIKHYELFNKFIIKNKNIHNDNTFFEIGGSYGQLAKLLINEYNENNIPINYNILEFSIDHYPEIEHVKYISGNCETYNFIGINTVIMSHVFEHLYEPKKFLKNIFVSNVKEVFISIPDMDNLIKIGDINNLNIYHTFYINTEFIKYLFQLFNFILKDIYYYDNNSIFYYFTKEKSIINNHFMINLNNNSLINTQRNFYREIKNKINNITIEKPFYICPSGLYGRFVYYYLNNDTKHNVLGFLDSDPIKINKRLCGTNLLTYKKQQIINNENPIVLIVSNKHNIELTNDILSYNSKTNIYYLKVY
jgi:hypothetical protein